ncbi:MAG: 5-dehydro-4-deoxy-D-glucuronate isomerase [Oscillospiraceae bacterium]|nr:5-dehydro-4-deoxy-D-glucuronate isomerase [Oscillospiraceae bacterium]
MDIRYSTGKEDFKRWTTEQVRDEFLIEAIFKADDVTAVYSHIDRIVTMGAMPVNAILKADKNFDCWKTFGVKFFLERRELGIINIGGAGTVTVDGADYELKNLEALYVGMGAQDISLKSASSGEPAKFYMCSVPAHKSFPTTAIPFEKAIHVDAGAAETCNKRVLHQFIHPKVLETCQLLMGVTMLESGSVWNTMPCHTHERRMEVYCYFNIPQDNVVFHLMGEPSETRHIVMQNEQAVISPSWSIHSGCGTSNYSFIWAMAGENIEFTDMDVLSTTGLR